MSLKKRLFRSNMTILVLALVALMLVITVVAALLEDTLLDGFESAEGAMLDKDVYAVLQAVDDLDTADLQRTEQSVGEFGYEFFLLKDGEILYGTENERSGELAEKFGAIRSRSSQPEVFYRENTTAVGKYETESGAYALAVRFGEPERWFGLFHGSLSFFLIVFVVAGVTAIFLLLILSSFFTGRISRKVMEPLDALAEGARRIQAGDLTEDIHYRGDEEFERVCSTFNDMQRAMLENREQRLRDEKARTDMVTGISHDLRTPLTSVRGYIQGILDGVADTEEKKTLYLKTAYEATEEMDVLLKKLFDFSRLESGQLPFHMVEVDLAEFAASYVAQREQILDEREVQISLFRGAEILPEVPVDIDQIPRVFDNLLENSVKYAGTVPVRIEIRVFEEAEGAETDGVDKDGAETGGAGNDCTGKDGAGKNCTETGGADKDGPAKNGVVVEWRDNGRGVPEEKLGDIFRRFYRCDEARTKKGSGVGLYVVKYIVERHGGTITAKNENGLVLKMYFPKGCR